MKYEETRALFAAHAMAAIMIKKPLYSEEGVAKDAWEQAEAIPKMDFGILKHVKGVFSTNKDIQP